MENSYLDSEKSDYEGLKNSLALIVEKVGENSELQKEITKVDDLATELTRVWTSQESRNSKAAIDEVNSELANVRAQLNRLMEELGKYNEAANAINTGTMYKNDKS